MEVRRVARFLPARGPAPASVIKTIARFERGAIVYRPRHPPNVSEFTALLALEARAPTAGALARLRIGFSSVLSASPSSVWGTVMATVMASMLISCGSPPPPAPLPNVYSQPASERLPIDGLWKTASEPAVYFQLDRGRMYLQQGFNPGEEQGSLFYTDIHQSAPRSYRCRRPVRDQGGIKWRPCELNLIEDGSLRATTPHPDGESDPDVRDFVSVARADEIWFAAQADAWHIVSVGEAHEPEPEAPIIAVPELPPAPERQELALVVPSRTSRFGRYRALIIGSADYMYLPSVATADGDASAVSKLLEERYGFEVTHLRNPSLADLARELERLQRDLRKTDNLLIYYAGHGFVSDELGRCYWFPVEALGDDASQGLANDEVASALLRMRAKHVMVVADSCFTAAQRREVGLQDDSGNAHERLSKLRTRVVLTSGGLEPIQDGQGSGHSVFTGALLAALESNGEILDGQTLFARIQQIVTTGASQTPEYANIEGADHAGGDFLFVPIP